jgi:FKBP-type peptidyl-prolyl cis-trans isomerase
MLQGEKRTLHIPAELAYGSRGAGRNIPPDADLRFEMEVVTILKR